MSTFGPYIEVDAQALFDMTTVRPTVGHISGVYHNAIHDDTASFAEVGVLTDDPFACEVSLSPCPYADHASPEQGTPSRDWCFSTVSMHDVISLSICEDRDTAEFQCLGMLLTYKDGHRESLGQVRFDKHCSQSADLDAWEFSSQHIKTKPVILSRLSGLSDNAESWYKLPRKGVISWWFGIKGNVMRI
jgi:hypothetical protein